MQASSTPPQSPSISQDDAARVLVLRVLSGKALTPAESAKKVKCSMRARLGDVVKTTAVEMVLPSGSCAFTSEFVFSDCTRAGLLSAPAQVLELTLYTSTAGLVTSKSQSRQVGLGALAVADKGSPQTAAWVAFEQGAEVKVSLFWKDLEPRAEEPSSPGMVPAAVAAAVASSPRSPASASPMRPRSPAMLRRLTSTEPAASSAPPLSALNFQPDSSFEASHARARLTVVVHQARNLKSANLAGGSDPYVGVSVRGSRFKTKVVRNTNDPAWNESFTFGAVEDLDEHDQLALVIKDWDQLGRNHDLGEVIFPLGTSAGYPVSVPTWFKVSPTADMRAKAPTGKPQVLGEIQVTVEFTPSASSASAQVKPVPFELEEVQRPRLVVNVLQARNLPACDSNGKSDPYLILTVNKERYKTKPRFKTLCPVFDAEFVFGESRLIQESDTLKLSCLDSDLGPGTMFDDLIGELEVPLFAVPKQPGEPKWYTLTSGDFPVAGEVQLAMHLEMPPPSVDIYKGKVWLYEMQVTVLEARGLLATDAKTRASDPYAVLECGADKWKTRTVAKSINPVWQERFVFRRPSAGEREGLGRGDELSLSVKSGGTVIGKLVLDVAGLADRMGYIDPSGKQMTHWFALESPSPNTDEHVEEDGEAEDGNGEDGGEEDDDSQSATSVRSMLRIPRLNLLSKRPSSSASTSSAPSSLAGPAASGSEDAGQVRLRVRLVPIGETRAVKKKSVVLKLDQVELGGGEAGAAEAAAAPEAVYCTVTLGYESMDTPVSLVRQHLAGSPASVQALLAFDNCDWVLAQAAKWRADVAKARKRGGAKSGPGRAALLGPAPDALKVLVKDADTDQTVCAFSGTLHEALEGAAEGGRLACSPRGRVGLSARVVESRAEMVPLLGHIHAHLLQFKSHAQAPGFKSSLRFVLKYGAKEVASQVYANDPNPLLGREEAHFAVFDVFTPLAVQVWEDKAAAKGPRPGRLLSRILRAGQAAPHVAEDAAGLQSSTLLGQASLSLFEMVEFETQTLFEEEATTKVVQEHAMKLLVRDAGGAVAGSLWLGARYVENMSGVLSANPNPPSRPPRPFSLANFRHEVNRLVTALGWLSGTGRNVGAVLDWESPTTTVSVLTVIVIVCSLDWFSSRPLCVLIHMVNRHRARANGAFLLPFEETDDSDARLEAEVRVAVLGAEVAAAASSSLQPTLEEHKAYQCKLSLVKDPGYFKSKVTLGASRVAADVTDGRPDFSKTKAGYNISYSSTYRPSVQVWRYSATEDAVPAFDFRVTNDTVQETLLVVVLRRGQGLLAADANGLSDPFVHLSVAGGQVQKSSVRSKTLSPEWDERFVFGRKTPVLETDVLLLSLFDSDGNLSAADKLGTVEIPLSDVRGTFAADTGQGVAFKVKPPPGEPLTKDAGAVFVSVSWLDLKRVPGWERPAKPLALPSGVGGGGGEQPAAEEEDESLPADSWTRCGAHLLIDLFETSKSHVLVGQAVVPMAALVESDDVRAQPVLHFSVSLDKRLDGSKPDHHIKTPVDAKLDLVCQMHLPDPKAKERRLALAAAKRTDRAGPLAKLRTINTQLAKVQNALFNVNNRLERMKNCFNWAQPRKTKLMFNLMIFLFCFFLVLPTRFVVLAVVLFFMTEHFRPMGTMGARFKHLLSQLPTDDDLRVVVKGEAATGKRVPMAKKKPGSKSAAGAAANGRASPRMDGSSAARGSRMMLRANSAPTDRAKPSLAALKQISPGDALMSGHMSFLVKGSGGVSKLLVGGPGSFSRRFFVLSSYGLHYWPDKTSSESKEPAGHFVQLESVQVCADVAQIVAGAEHLGGFLQVAAEGQTVWLFCSSEAKRDRWIEAIREVLV